MGFREISGVLLCSETRRKERLLGFHAAVPGADYWLERVRN